MILAHLGCSARRSCDQEGSQPEDEELKCNLDSPWNAAHCQRGLVQKHLVSHPLPTDSWIWFHWPAKLHITFSSRNKMNRRIHSRFLSVVNNFSPQLVSSVLDKATLVISDLFAIIFQLEFSKTIRYWPESTPTENPSPTCLALCLIIWIIGEYS